jgi:hypothetical protein
MRSRANAFHSLRPVGGIFNRKKEELKSILKDDEGTPTPPPSPKTPTLGELVKQMQPLIYDADDELCGGSPSAFFPKIGVRVNTPVFDHEKEELRLKKPQLFRVKTKRDDHGELDLTPKNHVHFRESYPSKFERVVHDEIDIAKINSEALERTPRAESPVPFLSLSEFVAEIKDAEPTKK